MRDTHKSFWLIGVANWLSTISAIIEREVATRFSGGSFGHAWAIIIPVSWIIAITVFFRWVGRDAPIPVETPLFLATGMLPYLVFRQTITSMMRTLRANRHLVSIGPATSEDFFAATTILELLNALLVSATTLFVISLWIGAPHIESPLTVLWGLLLACGIGLSLGRLTALLSVVSDSAMRLTPIFLRPFFWLSGIFFIAAEVPGWALDWLWFNPLMHSIELLRSGFFVDFNSTFAQSNVPIIAIVVFYFSSRLIEAHIDLQPGRGVFSP